MKFLSYIYIYGIYLIYVCISRLGVVQRRGSNSEWGSGLGSCLDPEGAESRALASGQDQRASAGMCAKGDRWVIWGVGGDTRMLGQRLGSVKGNS